MPANHLVYDVESTGQYPGEYAMIQLGIVDLNGNEFYGEFKPAPHHKFDPGAMNAIGLSIEEVMKYPEAGNTMDELMDWVKTTYNGQRVITWSDNPAFDWQWVNHYFHAFYKQNPFGFSSRRIGDLYAGHMQDPSAASKWKRLRKTKHTHNALDDAKGNAEALEQIMSMIRTKR